MSYRSNVKIVSRPLLTKSECEVCGYLARDFDDIVSIQADGACTDCKNNFKFLDKIAWAQGQRPTQEVARKRLNILIDEV